MRQPEITSVLVGSALFTSLDACAIDAVASSCVERSFPRGQYLFHQGDPGDRLFIIASGLVKVVFALEHGDELVLATLGPGQVVGELAVLDRVPRSASVVAVRQTTALMLDRQVLLRLMHNHPSVLEAMMALLGQLVRRLTEQTGELAFLDVAGRLAKLLLRLADAQGDPTEPVVLDLGLSQSELGAMIGASRPAVNRVLQSMGSRGLIEVSGQVIVLRDLAALRRRAGG